MKIGKLYVVVWTLVTELNRGDVLHYDRSFSTKTLARSYIAKEQKTNTSVKFMVLKVTND